MDGHSFKCFTIPWKSVQLWIVLELIASYWSNKNLQQSCQLSKLKSWRHSTLWMATSIHGVASVTKYVHLSKQLLQCLRQNLLSGYCQMSSWSPAIAFSYMRSIWVFPWESPLCIIKCHSGWSGSIHWASFVPNKQGLLYKSISPFHCENKLVVLTTEWLPWWQTSWRDNLWEVHLWYLRPIA